MGVFSTLFGVILPGLGVTSFVVFRLGGELPRATLQTGRRMGMTYNYFKILLKHLTPRSYEGVDLVRSLR